LFELVKKIISENIPPLVGNSAQFIYLEVITS